MNIAQWRTLTLGADNPAETMIKDPQTRRLFLRLRRRARDGEVSATFVFRFRPKHEAGSKRPAPVTITLGPRSETTLKQARNKAAALNSTIDEGLDPRMVRMDAADAARERVLEKLIDDYYIDMTERGVVNRDSIRGTLRKRLACWLKLDIDQMTRSDWTREVAKVNPRTGRVYKDANQRINRFLSFVVSRDHLQVHPLAALRHQRRTRAQEMEAKAQRSAGIGGTSGRALSDGELRRVWQAASDTGNPYHRLTRAQLLTGCRRGELAQLRHEWVEGDWLVFPAEVTKQGRPHYVYITAPFRAALGHEPTPSGLVFPSARGPRVQTHLSEVVMSGWGPLQKRFNEQCGIADLRSHWFRKTVATRLLERGEQRQAVRALLGQKTGTDRLDDAYDLRDWRDEQERLAKVWAAHITSVTDGPVRLEVVA
ncbi:tyrosine-type recombinase/integrase [Roseibium sp.]|uniref:tyrosine-type recombinase/integrase n=1 Tax=Roseibium sp. TaxID=1936156 RepID=UPI003B51349D